MISNIVFIAFIVFFRKPFFNRITNSTFHKKRKGQDYDKVSFNFPNTSFTVSKN